MLISAKVFEGLIADRARAQGMAHALAQQNTALQSTMDWMKVRLTQVERERAQLMFNYMGVKVEVPTIETEAPARITTDMILNETVSFEDIGDTDAERLGASWDDNGELVYRKN